MQNYSYLKPSSRALSQVGYQQTGGTRTMFGVPSQTYTNEQTQAVHRLREYLKHKKHKRAFEDSLLLRYCYLGSFRTAESVEIFRYYEEWEAVAQVPRQKSKSILHSGAFYCYGHDQFLVPNIYFHPARLNLQQNQIKDYLGTLKMFLQPILEHMLLDGKIEQWNIVLDLAGFDQQKLSNNYEIILQNMKKVMYAYPFRLKKLFVVERSASSRWGLGKNSDKGQVQQLIRQLEVGEKVVKITSMADFDQNIAKDQRESQYGGDLDDLREFWPILSTNKLMEENSKFMGDISDTSSEYHSVQNKENDEFFQENLPAICDLKANCTLF